MPNFVVQGGDPRGDGWGGPGYTLLTERSPIEFNCGAVGMARQEYDTKVSQFLLLFMTDHSPSIRGWSYANTRDFGEVPILGVVECGIVGLRPMKKATHVMYWQSPLSQWMNVEKSFVISKEI